jgi:hypothetical protein
MTYLNSGKLFSCVGDFRKCEGNGYRRQTIKWSMWNWACLTRCGWILAIVANAWILMLEATHVSTSTRNENIRHYKWRVVHEWLLRMLSGRVVATVYWPRNPSHAHLSHSLQESSPCLLTVLVIFWLFVFCWPYDLKVPLWNAVIPKKVTSTYRHFYFTQFEEGLPQWQRQNTEIRTFV